MSDRNSTCSSRKPVGRLERADVRAAARARTRLAARDAAVQVRVTEQRRAPTSRLSCSGASAAFHDAGLRVGRLARREELALAEEAVTAGDRERHDDAVAALAACDDRAPASSTTAHELVARMSPSLHAGDLPAVRCRSEPQIAVAVDAKQDVVVVDQDRVGDAFDADVLAGRGR
jgi:hypothetical protein